MELAAKGDGRKEVVLKVRARHPLDSTDTPLTYQLLDY